MSKTGTRAELSVYVDYSVLHLARLHPGPSIGQDNEYVMKQLLGLSEERYRELVAREVIC